MERIQEFTTTAGAAVNQETGVLSGVKLLGLESKNGRSYPKSTIAKAAALYEGAKVNVNHTRESRQYQDRIGNVRGVTVREDGLYGDFHFNPKHPVVGQLLWDAVNAPGNVGFSHDVEARCAKQGGKTVVEEIIRVQSVDLVADPATTRGLFESANGKEKTVELHDITEAQLREGRPDLVEQIVKEAIKQQATSSEAKAKDDRIKALEAELDAIKVKAKAAERAAAIEAELKEAKLPDSAVTDVFRKQLQEATDAAARKALIEDRRALLAGSKPVSRDHIHEGEQLTTEQFVRNLKG